MAFGALTASNSAGAILSSYMVMRPSSPRIACPVAKWSDFYLSGARPKDKLISTVKKSFKAKTIAKQVRGVKGEIRIFKGQFINDVALSIIDDAVNNIPLLV